MLTAKKLTRKIVIVSILSMFICNTVYAVLIPFVMNYSVEIMHEFWVKMVVATLSISPIAAICVYLFYRPIERALLILERGKEIPKETMIKARKSFVFIPLFLFFIGAFAYLLGLALNFTTDLLKHNPMETDQLVSRAITAVSWGVLNGIVTARMLNIFLIEAKLRMNIFNLDNQVYGEKRESSKIRLLSSGVIFFIFLTCFAGVIFYNYEKAGFVEKSSEIKSLVQKVKTGETSFGNISAETDKIIDSGRQKQFERFFTVIFIFLALFLIVVTLFYIIVLEVQTHIDNLNSQVRKYFQGEIDLTRRINIISFDDIGEMTAGINYLINLLSSTFSAMKKLTGEVYLSSQITEKTVRDSHNQASELTVLMNEVEASTNTQLNVIRNTVDTFDTMVNRTQTSIRLINSQTQAVESTAQAVKKMVDSFNNMTNSAILSETLFSELAASIEKGKSEVNNSTKSIYEINEVSSKVSEIVKIIEDIADQSNILAMNAAIEASHAGEYGKGFSIVAQEMRGLSESTAQSTGDIEKLVWEMQRKNQAGVLISENLIKIFEELFHGMQDTGRLITEIADSSRQQSQTAKENLKDIDKLINLTNGLKIDGFG